MACSAALAGARADASDATALCHADVQVLVAYIPRAEPPLAYQAREAAGKRLKQSSVLSVLQGQAAHGCTVERAAEPVVGREAAVCTQAAPQLVPCWEVAQAAVALRAPLTPAALGPFGLMLLSVAVLPLWRPHWWDDNVNRLKVPSSNTVSFVIHAVHN